MIKLFGKLSEQELRKLDESGKKILYVTHPYPHGYHDNNPSFEEFIRLGEHRKYILLVAEGNPRVERLKNRLAELGVKPTDGVFIVRTKKVDVPTPVIGWQRLIGKLRHVNPQGVIVDGNYWRRYSVTGMKNDFLKLKGRIRENVARRRNLRENAELKKKNGTFRALLNQQPNASGEIWGKCAAVTHAKLKATGLFNVRKSQKFHIK
jgi:hypothetical protein